jgi:hypothetical protein
MNKVSLAGYASKDAAPASVDDPPAALCHYCERPMDGDSWECACGLVECCPGCVAEVDEYHRGGECGLDRALDRALAKGDKRFGFRTPPSWSERGSERPGHDSGHS